MKDIDLYKAISKQAALNDNRTAHANEQILVLSEFKVKLLLNDSNLLQFVKVSA
jgi:hypothetical protein